MVGYPQQPSEIVFVRRESPFGLMCIALWICDVAETSGISASITFKDNPMAKTPSKDYKRREREFKKAEKRRAREEAKAEKLAAERAAAALAAEEAAKQAEAELKAKIEAEFEAELQAEIEAEKKKGA